MAIAKVVEMTEEPSVSDLLAGMQAPKTSSSRKSTVPIVTGHEEFADRAAQAIRHYKQAETEKKLASSEVLEFARAVYALSAVEGNFTKSLNLAGKQTNGVRVSFKDSFDAIPIAARQELVEILGEKYSVLFEESRKLALKRTDDGTIRFLMEKLGRETFQELFSVDVAIVPKVGFDRQQFELPEQVRQTFQQKGTSVVAI